MTDNELRDHIATIAFTEMLRAEIAHEAKNAEGPIFDDITPEHVRAFSAPRITKAAYAYADAMLKSKNQTTV